MDIQGYTKVPDEVTERAYDTLKFENSASLTDKMIIRQYRYSQKNGDFKLHTEETDTHLICELTVNGDTHSCRIPLEVDSVTSELYPLGDIEFENVKLLSVSFGYESGWTNEAFKVNYWADPIDEDNELEPYFRDNFHILSQFYTPRGLICDPSIEEVVDCTNDDSERNYLICDIHNFTQVATPNPWAKYSMAVLYENEELAEKVFNHKKLHGNKENYHLTPPSQMPNFDSD